MSLLRDERWPVARKLQQPKPGPIESAATETPEAIDAAFDRAEDEAPGS